VTFSRKLVRVTANNIGTVFFGRILETKSGKGVEWPRRRLSEFSLLEVCSNLLLPDICSNGLIFVCSNSLCPTFYEFTCSKFVRILFCPTIVRKHCVQLYFVRQLFEFSLFEFFLSYVVELRQCLGEIS
jgi:hypothetical protein